MAIEYSTAEKQLLRDSVSADPVVAANALAKVATALELPLRKGIQAGDIVSFIFEDIPVENQRSSAEFPVHFMEPGTENQYIGFTIPNHGSIPQKLIAGDYVTVPVVDIAGMLDWDNRYARDARWDVALEAAENVRNQLVKKRNDMGWHTIINSGYDRGAIVADSDAAQGQFTTRLVSLLKNIMTRNGGGNSNSINRSMLTDLFVSPEALSDMRSWNVDQIDEFTRREIFTARDGIISRIFSVNIHETPEFGEGQEYQNFFESTLGATMPVTSGHSDVEIVVGLDLTRRSFVSPVAEEVTLVPDNTRVRHRQTGLLAFESRGYAVLDSRSVLLGSF